jgi:hypothetical protein
MSFKCNKHSGKALILVKRKSNFSSVGSFDNEFGSDSRFSQPHKLISFRRCKSDKISVRKEIFLHHRNSKIVRFGKQLSLVKNSDIE